jgi:hypothetical protein
MAKNVRKSVDPVVAQLEPKFENQIPLGATASFRTAYI